MVQKIETDSDWDKDEENYEPAFKTTTIANVTQNELKKPKENRENP